GLRSYWEDSPHKAAYSPERLYQFYAVMWQCTRLAHLPYATEALLRHGISIREQSAPDDVVMKATLYLRLANSLRDLKEDALADTEASKAAALLKTTSDATARKYALSTQVEVAAFRLQRGEIEFALRAIEPLRELLLSQDDFLRLDFYRLSGDIYLRLGRFDDAQSAYTAGIEIAEQSFKALPDQNSRLHWLAATEGIYRGLTQTLLS